MMETARRKAPFPSRFGSPPLDQPFRDIRIMFKNNTILQFPRK
jgi:hypothetical protein